MNFRKKLEFELVFGPYYVDLTKTTSKNGLSTPISKHGRQIDLLDIHWKVKTINNNKFHDCYFQDFERVQFEE